MYLVLDTETDRLNVPNERSSHPDQPHMMSITMILLDAELRRQSLYSTYVLADWTREVDPGAFAAHGITKEHCNKYGVGHGAVMAHVEHFLDRCEAIVAYNAFYDKKMIKVGCARLNKLFGDPLREKLESKQVICPMQIARRQGWGLENNKQVTIYKHLFGEDLVGAHGSLVDAMACERIFIHMHKAGLVTGAPTTTITQSAETPL